MPALRAARDQHLPETPQSVASRAWQLTGERLGEADKPQFAGAWKFFSARELAEYAKSDDPTMASIGIAALNSLLGWDENHAAKINAVEVLVERGRGKNVALVGHFPFVPKLRQAAGQLWVLELHPSGDDQPADAAGDLIPRADVVAITGSTLVNHTLDGLLSLCRPDSLVMVLGPSTPCSPVLFHSGVSILSGTRVVDESAVLRTVAQGGSFREVEGVQLLTLWRDPPCTVTEPQVKNPGHDEIAKTTASAPGGPEHRSPGARLSAGTITDDDEVSPAEEPR